MNRLAYRLLTRKMLHTVDAGRASRSRCEYARDCDQHRDCYTTSPLGILNGIIPRLTGGYLLGLLVYPEREHIVGITFLKP